MNIRVFIFCLFLLGISIIVSADILDDFEIIPGLRFWGADIGVNYKGVSFFPGVTTRLCVWLGAGYETIGYYRDSDGIQYYPTYGDDPNLALFNRWNILWALGIRQGIFNDPAKNDNLLEAHLFYRGLNDNNEETDEPAALIFTTDYPDASGILLHTFVTGLFFNTVVVNQIQRKRSGVKADISLEYAPGFINDSADYTRVTVDIRGYLTLIDLDPENKNKKNVFNLYISDRFLFDGIVGKYIPIVARQNVGGRELKSLEALGGIMRGIESRRFDGYLKMVNNFDIRMNLPTVWIIVPGIVLYFDVGIADELNYRLAAENLHYSTGIGASFYGLGFDLVVYANYWFNQERFTISFEFKLHF